MKYICTLLLIAYHILGFSQLNQQLVTYGQVWGFLKYHHEYPSQVDWDARLLADFEKLQGADQVEAKSIIDDLFKSCKISEVENYDTTDVILLKGVFDWVNTASLSLDHIDYIQQLKKQKLNFKNSYVSNNKVGSANFTTENYYEDVALETKFQFLALTRYWNAVNYFFPYRDLIPQNWTAVYHELLPEFLNVASFDDYYRAVLKLSAKIRDSHGTIIIKEESKRNQELSKYRFTPFHAIHLNNKTYVVRTIDSAIDGDMILKGDQIIAIDGISAADRWNEISRYQSSSNDYVAKRSDYLFKRVESDSITVTLLRDQKEVTHTIATVSLEDLKEDWNISKPTESQQHAYEPRVDSISGVAYLYLDLGILKREDITKSFRKELRKYDHLVIDVRNYPSGTYYSLCKYLLKGKRHFAHAGIINTKIPGSISWIPTQKVGSFRGKYKGSVYILVDRNTQSHAEYTVMALQQHPRSVTIGGQTAGADGNVTRIPMPYNLEAMVTGIAIVYPDGKQTQQIGIHRDIKITQDKTYLNEPKNDRILNAALQLIRERP